jgi:LPS export ABC transporter protein LptC
MPRFLRRLFSAASKNNAAWFIGAGLIPVGRSAAGLAAAGVLSVLAGACSFDYGDLSAGNRENEPDLIMRGLEYVRVRDGNPSIRVQADSAERFEDARIMKIRDLRFEQYAPNDPEANALGSAGSARIDLATGNAVLRDGVRVVVPSEDLSITTRSLDWDDETRYLAGDPAVPVRIERGDGTSMTGSGFFADTRSRTWEFTGGVQGVFVEEEKATPEPGAPAESAGPAAPETSDGLAAPAAPVEFPPAAPAESPADGSSGVPAAPPEAYP